MLVGLPERAGPRWSWAPSLAAVALASIAVALVLRATAHGPGLSPDSLTYLLLARSLESGHGFRFLDQPMTHFPPGYPALLAWLGAVGPESLERARGLHAVLFALDALLLAAVAARAAGGFPWAGVVAALFLVASPQMLAVHAMAWSEPPFVALVLAATWCFSSRLAGARRTALVAGAACLALALFTRYAGVALVPAFVLVFLAWGRFRFRERVIDAAVVVLLGLGPLLAWLGHNSVASGSATGRALSWHPFGAGSFEQGLQTARLLWGLGPQPGWALLAALPLLALGVATAASLLAVRRNVWGRGERVEASATAGLTAACCLSYALFLVVSISVLDADTPVDVRVAMPFHALSIVPVAALPTLLRCGRRTADISWLLLATLAAVGLPRAVAEADAMGRSGHGFAARYWRDSPTLAFTRSLPRATPAYSNGPDLVAFATGRAARDIPARASRVSLMARPGFERELDAMCAQVVAGAAILIHLDGIHWRWQLPTVGELETRCGLSAGARFADGVVHAANSPAR